ncbi:MAG: S8 family serine peptidase [Candidatus Eisenbacteria bacterium]|nr:S8 family serine peptidase [Candidatus Eisenbacteria bacterium]
MRRLSVVLILLACSFVASAPAEEPQFTVVPRSNAPAFIGYVDGEFIVRFADLSASTSRLSVLGKAELGVPSLDGLAERYDVTDIHPLFPGAKASTGLPDLSTYHRVVFDKTRALDEVMEAYRGDPHVVSVEPIGIHTVLATPNDGYYANQWHLNSTSDHDLDAPEAWNVETGDTGVIVAILDTGVRYFHKDLGGSNASYSAPTAVDGNMWVNWTEKNGTSGVDDDGNGYVDDWIGYDFVTGATQCWSGEDCSTIDNDPRDFNGHGTHCAGNVAAINNNGYATCSTPGGWGSGAQQPSGNGVKAMACRIGWSGSYLGQEVGYVRMDFAAQAFYYAANNGAKIASCSWGSSNSGGVAAAIDYFLAAGGMIFKAAGNDGTQTADYMCARTDIISVAATDENDCKADFSTYGTWVDISAPGVNITSLYHSHSSPSSDYVAAMDGTSMATPIAGSVAALIWSRHTDWTAAQVKAQLLATADPIDGLSCNASYAGKLGSGRVNAYAAVNDGCVAPVASFAGTPLSGYAPLAVTFTDQSSGSPTSWSWNFGDGGTSTAQSPSHSYTATGTYTVSLTVTNACGSDSETKTNYITVTTCSAPVAAFSGTPLSGNTPLTVVFTDQSSGSPTSWSWNFGDGGTSTAQNPSHVYTSEGSFTVTLTATNACGSDGETKTNYITTTTPAQQCDDFADGNITNWTNRTGTWAATGGYMKGNSNTSDAYITSPFGSFGTATIDADVRMNSGRSSRNARIVFAYTNARNYRFIEGDDVNNRWRIYQRVNGRNTSMASVSRTIATTTWYHVQLRAAADGNVTLYVDGTAVTSYKFSSAVTGLIGCGFNKANSDFDNFCVSATAALSEPAYERDAEVAMLAAAPGDGEVEWNYPNPFRGSTTISFTLAEPAHIRLEVFNVLGRRVTTLREEYAPAGRMAVVWDGRTDTGEAAGAGVYFYRLSVNGEQTLRKMTLLR